MTPEAAIAGALAFLLNDDRGDALGVAVSGGGDSMALLVLAHDWARAHGMSIRAATVDHGLRPEAAEEAAFVAAFCAGRGIAHDVLHWTGWDGTGNLMAEARAARRALLEGWAAEHGLKTVLLGHTADDQAETFLMRLARGSGVDGLAGMPVSDDGPFLRPLLSVRRSALRDVLTARGVSWIDDPTNEDARFDRIKARQMVPHLEALGLTVDRVLATVAHMDRARSTLEEAAVQFAARHVRAEAGDLVFERAAFEMTAGDSPGRVLSAAIRWIGGRDYRPRYAALVDLAAALGAGEARTLNGVRMLPDGDAVRLTRELSAVEGPVTPADGAEVALWDRRWAVRPPAASGVFDAGLTVGALGEDIVMCPGWREAGLPRVSLMATPAVRKGTTLIAAPQAGFNPSFSARIVAEFADTLVSH